MGGCNDGIYISGSFCVSRTAATGIPKLETGPQKSAIRVVSSQLRVERLEKYWYWYHMTYELSRHSLEQNAILFSR